MTEYSVRAEGTTRLHSADYVEAELLLSQGTNVNAQDELGNTPLHYAGYSKGVLLLRYEADATIKNNDGRTPYEERMYFCSNSEAANQTLEFQLVRNAQRAQESAKEKAALLEGLGKSFVGKECHGERQIIQRRM